MHRTEDPLASPSRELHHRSSIYNQSVTSPRQAEPRRLCVSLCGSQRAMQQTKAHMRKARAALRGGVDVSFELAADYHG